MVRRKSNNAASENYTLTPAEYAMMMNANTQPLDEQPEPPTSNCTLQLESSQRQPDENPAAEEEEFVRPMTPDLMPAPEQAEQWAAAFKVEDAPIPAAEVLPDQPATEAPQQDCAIAEDLPPAVAPAPAQPSESPTQKRVGNLRSKPYWWTDKSRTLGFPDFCETMYRQPELARVSPRELEIIWQKLSQDERANFGDPVVIALVTQMWSDRCQLTQPLGTAPPPATSPVVPEEEVASRPVTTSAQAVEENPQVTETPAEATPASPSLDAILKAACKTAAAKLGVPKAEQTTISPEKVKPQEPAPSPKKSEPPEDVGLLLLSKLARLYFDESCYMVDKRSSSAALPKKVKHAKRIRTDNFAQDDCKAVA